MNQKIATSIAFAKNFLVTGAITETSRYVEIEICKHLPKGEDKIIVEFGVGHGNITREILNNISATSKVYAFEVNKDFCEHVKNTITDPRLIVINDSAHRVKQYIKAPVDIVISSIPFSFFSKEKGKAILEGTYDLLNNDAYFSQVSYSRSNLKKFQKVFESCDTAINKKNRIEQVCHCKKSL